MSKNKQKIVVAMSGGVDSSVAAALLKEQGHEVIGVTMQVWPARNATHSVAGGPSKKAFGGCCSLEAINDAKRVADSLSIPHYTLNFRDVFKEKVIDNFVEEYKCGRTPNPCIRCNQFIKFDHLERKARELGAEFVATGHYARIRKENNFQLLKGVDQKKDQAYVLYMMNQENLAHTMFPLGDLTKEQVRKMAKDFGLPVAEKAESQEICFVDDDDYGRFLKEVYPEAVKPGPILDKDGNIVGMHGGIAFYTLGQRKGIGAHQAMPKYVIQIDREKNIIVIGDNEDTFGKELTAKQVNFIGGSVDRLLGGREMEVTAKIRYNSAEAKAVVRLLGGLVVSVEFEEPQRSITPGQSVVFYKGDEVIGGGIIN